MSQPDYNDKHLIDKAIDGILGRLDRWEPSPCGLDIYQVWIVATELERVRAEARAAADKAKQEGR